MKKYMYVCTLTDDRIPTLVCVVPTEQDAREWVEQNKGKHKGWMSKFQWASYQRVEYRA